MATPLNSEQQSVINSIVEGDNVFVTGSAGVGKSFVIKEICRVLDERGKTFALLAPTGVAAVNIGGMTIHRFARLTPQTESLADYVKMNRTRRGWKDRWCGLHTLIIDEVSMVHPDTLVLLNDITKLHRRNNAVFGGLQVVLIGDLFQLPYVPNKSDKEYKYIFETQVWKELGMKVHLLKKVMRQNDTEFIQALNDIRVGKLSDAVSKMLTYCSTNKKDKNKHYVKLYALNAQRDMENERKLTKLETEKKVYKAIDVGDDKYLTGCRAVKTLELRLECPVMLLWNLPEHDLSNGSVGKVVAFEADGPRVKFWAGPEVVLSPVAWKITEKVGSCHKTLAARTQVPLTIAYSISVHKSQSLTLDYVEVDLAGTFAAGQMYVALSRAKTMEGLVISNFDKRCLMVDDHIVQFYETCEERN